MGEPSFVSLPSLLNIWCVVVMGGLGQEDSVVRDGALWELMVLWQFVRDWSSRKMVVLGAALIKNIKKTKLSKIEIWSRESIDMSMLSKSHSAMFW